MRKRRSWFLKLAQWMSRATGKSIAFILALAVVIVWAATGPMFNFSDTWQLVINTGTTIVTFLMVFLIQNTQNRDTGALQIKLDELIRAVKGAQTALLDLEELDDEHIERLRHEYRRLAREARQAIKTGRPVIDQPDAPRC